jgi:hypothetical protein
MAVVIVSVIVVSVIVVTMVVMGRRRMRVAVAMIAVMLDLIARGVAGMRAEQRDQASKDGAQQRQKDNRLNHD